MKKDGDRINRLIPNTTLCETALIRKSYGAGRGLATLSNRKLTQDICYLKVCLLLTKNIDRENKDLKNFIYSVTTDS